MGGAWLVLRQWRVPCLIHGVAFLMAGAAFPIAVLPAEIRWLSYALPHTCALDAMLHTLLGRPTLVPMWAELLILSLTAVVAGISGIAASTATSHSTCRGAGECRPPAPGVLIPVDPAPTLVRLELRTVRRSGPGHCGHWESQRPEVEVSLDGQLRTRLRERAGLLKQIHHLIQKDGRVRAAWVEGSVARGNDDALSDIDIFVVVADDAVEDFIDNRRCHAAKPARPILLMDNLQNSLLRGAYLLAWYGGEAGPQHVDWFWQAESEARRPEEANVLFDRAGIRRVPGDLATMPGPSLGPNPPLRELLTHKTTFVWAMSLIVAKHIARRNGETVARMTGVVARTLTDLVSLCGSSMVPLEGLEDGLEAASALTQFQVLRKLARRADALGCQLASLGIVVPAEAVGQAHRFFELAESVATQDADLLPPELHRLQSR